MQNELETFNGLWESFATALKGALLDLSKKDELDLDHAQIALAEQIMSWQNDYTTEGRWIKKLISEDEAWGNLVKKILTNDMKFDELPKVQNKRIGTILGAIGGGALGYGVTAAADINSAAIIASTVVATAIGGVVGNGIDNKNKNQAIEKTINGYMEQLDTYYHAVVNALNNH